MKERGIKVSQPLWRNRRALRDGGQVNLGGDLRGACRWLRRGLIAAT